MRFCDKCVGPSGAICDFCKHWHSEDLENRNFYDDDGWCVLHDKHTDIADSCEDFWCRSAKL